MDYLLILIAYLFGSLNSAIILCKALSLSDPRKQGSGNPGATNVLRFGGKKLAATVLFFDILKGVIPVLIALIIGMDHAVVAVVAFAAFIGHLYPLFFKFKGGKGVATAFGVLVAMNWMVGLSILATWLIMAFTFRLSSLSALTASVLAPLYAWLFIGDHITTVITVIMSALLLWRHRSNIRNLLAGKEPKIGSKKKQAI
ncbi:MAG: glycerol-3-phosphate 1-O-acyltransferase PlsY [Gammaproteobacteria bacterium]|nr:glycerol-3-phosphate 1-O-acyltransferase PlsY [Gammaproteobacteria bacterium]MCF6231406.1 glycerol-3-phosphate 1-O-acyltransferase PlsY [Gammaproteobacteria bacterium]